MVFFFHKNGAANLYHRDFACGCGSGTLGELLGQIILRHMRVTPPKEAFGFRMCGIWPARPHESLRLSRQMCIFYKLAFRIRGCSFARLKLGVESSMTGNPVDRGSYLSPSGRN